MCTANLYIDMVHRVEPTNLFLEISQNDCRIFVGLKVWDSKDLRAESWKMLEHWNYGLPPDISSNLFWISLIEVAHVRNMMIYVYI